jgi:hypothetical protein
MGITRMPVCPGAWSGERLLVVTHHAALPQYCVKCGGPTNESLLKRKFSWHPPWYAVFILFGLLPCAIIALAASKRIVVHVPLCSKHRERYKGLRLAAILLLLGGIPEMVAAGTYLPADYQGIGIFAGFMALLTGLICLSIYGSVLRPKFIDNDFGYFRNVSVNFLTLLPPRPPNVPPALVLSHCGRTGDR